VSARVAAAAQAHAAAVAGAAGGEPAAPLAAPAPAAPRRHFQAELEINDFPQAARWRATHRSTTDAVEEATGAAVIAKGVYVDKGRDPPPGERRMYLLIQGPSADAVRAAKAQLKAVIEEATEKAMRRETGAAGPAVGKYNVL
jgi:ATP-dependent RNA helicase DDX46/PRP5